MLNEVSEGGDMKMQIHRVLLVGLYLHSLPLLPGIMVTLRSRSELVQATPTHEGKMGTAPIGSITKILRWSI